MTNLLKIKQISTDRDIKGLRTLYDNIEFQVQSLESLNIESETMVHFLHQSLWKDFRIKLNC